MLPEQVAVLDGHAEELADDRHRERVAEAGDDVHPAVGADPVEDVVDDPLDARPETLDDLGREGLAHQVPQPGVVGRVHEQHDPGEQLLGGGRGAGLGEEPPAGPPRVAAPAGLTKERLHVAVTGEDPSSVLGSRWTGSVSRSCR